MKNQYRSLLETSDEAGSYEFPRNFDYDALERDALIINNELHEKLEVKTKFEGAIFNQDASFSIAIILQDYIKTEDRIIYQPTIRFSNFGRLCTLTMLELIPQDIIENIINIINTRGFHYIPEEVLDADYDGAMAEDDIFSTWWDRYFDWL